MAIPFLKGIDVSGAVDLSNLTIDGAQGTDGQVLTSTGSGIAWEDASGGASLSGGEASKVAVWSATDTLTHNDNFHFDTTNVRLGIGDSNPNRTLVVSETRTGSTASDAYTAIVKSVQSSGASPNPGTGGLKVQYTSSSSNVHAFGLVAGSSSSDFLTTGPMHFYTNSDLDTVSATGFAMQLDTSQRLTIGSMTASQKLNVSGSVTADRYYGNTSTVYYVDPNDSTTAAVLAGGLEIGYGSAGEYRIEVGEGRTGNGYAYIDFVGDTTYSDYGLRLIRNNSGANTSSQLVHRGTGNLEFKTWDAGAMIFSTTNSERMRIASGGNVGIGTTSPTTGKLVVHGGDIEVRDSTGNSGGRIKSYDEHHAIYFREGGNNQINYYEYGGNVSAGGGHRFFTGGTKPNQTLKVQIGDDYTQINNSTRSPIFYDSNNTGYYVDPSGDSKIVGLKLEPGSGNNVTGSDNVLWVYRTNDNDWGIQIDADQGSATDYGFEFFGGSSHSYAYSAVAAGTRYFTVGSSHSQHNGSFRAPIFYDSNDTGYFMDLSSSSVAIDMNGYIYQANESYDIDASRANAIYQATRATQTDRGTWPASYMFAVNFGDRTKGIQLASRFGGANELYFRTGTDNPSSENGANTWKNWRQLYHVDYHPEADTWTTARTITIGNTGKSVDGSGNVSWTLAEIGAQAAGSYAAAGDENIIDGATSIWNADGDGDVFTYNDSNPTHNGDQVGAVINIKGDGGELGSLIRAGIYTGDHISVSRGYYVGAELNTTDANTTQVINSSGYWTGYPVFPSDSFSKSNISTRTESGFYQDSSPTSGEGWPALGGNTSWAHLISCTHSNDSNYYAMQLSASFYNQNLYYRSTAGSGTTGWSKMWSDQNDGSGSGLDADLLDGIQGADYFKKQNDIGGSVDLNTLTTDGYYHQNANANAASGSNYPAAAAGMLSVVSDGSMVYQTYHQYNGNAYYHRSYYNGTWYAWRKVWQDGNDGSGSGLDADTVDGIQGASFLRSDADDTATGQITITTSGNALTVTSQQSIGAIITGGNNSSDIIQLKKGSNIEAKLDTSGNWHVDADVIAYSTSISSDKKLKTNISTLTDALDKTIKLRGVNFDWIDENKPNNQVGFIAQEVEKVLPEVVKNVETLNKENETHKVVDYAAVVPLLVEAIKEQQKQIDELNSIINGSS